MQRAELERELERLHAACWGWALACCARDRDTAEETLQSAYLKILSGQARFDGRSELKTWVFGVVRRTAHEEMRRRSARGRREQSDEIRLSEAADAAPAADAAATIAEERAGLIAALALLSPRQREVLELVFYHDMTIEEAAAVMRISLGSARTHYDRGKKAMAIALAPSRNREGTS
jgi:RNA polymerase sigma-70 factor (ECF subfamily)